jgi:hypothetical protein
MPARLIVFVYKLQNPLNGSAASGALVGSKLSSEAVQEVGTHTEIIPSGQRTIANE